ncbi:hypothetical protein CIT31_02125 [Mesorhizobium wenxiniae]|uniref:Uncharacterized protein n=1 Tax=Mesorhizobium wenxiniae TaxID=2014805 RepID=A0A271KPZ5_9HYPH|nr:hypothetical protein CIT31_02125 [Mesorhizobium wenxiniae]
MERRMSTMGTLAKYAMAANAIRSVSVINRTGIASLLAPLLTFGHQRRLARRRLAVGCLRDRECGPRSAQVDILQMSIRERMNRGKGIGLVKAPMKLIHWASLCYAKVGEHHFG